MRFFDVKDKLSRRWLASLVLVLTAVVSLWLYSFSRPLAIEIPVGLHGDSEGMFLYRGSLWTHLEGLYPFYRSAGDWIVFGEHPGKNAYFLSTVNRRTGEHVRFKPDYPGYFVFRFGFSNYVTEPVEHGIRIRYSQPDRSLSLILKPIDGSIIYEKIDLPGPVE